MQNFKIISLTAALVMSSSNIVLAQACTDAGTTITCAGDQGFDDDTRDDVNLTVTGGAVINDASDAAVDLDNRNTITNNGSVTTTDGGDGDGLRADNRNTITNNGSIDASDDGIKVEDNNTIVNNGTIEADDEGIDVDDNNTITNFGTIKSTGNNDHGIEGDNRNTVINHGTIETTGNNGDAIDLDDRANVTNNGTIIATDDAIKVDNRATIVNNGTIEAGDEGIEADTRANITNNGMIDADEDGIELDDGTVVNNGKIESDQAAIIITSDANDRRTRVTNNGEIMGRRGIIAEGGNNQNHRITNNGSIVSTNGLAIQLNRGADRLTNAGSITAEMSNAVSLGRGNDQVTNSGSITSNTGTALLTGRGNDVLRNNGLISGGGGTAVDMGRDDDRFIWQSNSEVIGSVRMNSGNDRLIVQAADVIGATEFYSVETVNIQAGSTAIFDPTALPGADDGILYTGSSTAFGATGAIVGNLAHDLTRRLLNSEGGATTPIATQGAAQSGNWWTFANATFQTDRGQGFTQENQNITLGRSLGSVEVFFGFENATADVTASTQSVEQQMMYAGVTGSYAIDENTQLIGLALLGLTDTDYVSPGTTASTDGTFGAISARINHNHAGYVFGAYAGYARQNLDAIAAGALSFGTQNADAVFGGFDIRGQTIDYDNGWSMSPIVGFGKQNGSADGVSMSAGGQTVTVAGTNFNQEFVTAGLDFIKDNMTSSVRMRMDPGAYMTLDVGFRFNF